MAQQSSDDDQNARHTWRHPTPWLLAQLGRACPMLREIQPMVAHLATGGSTEAGGMEAGSAGGAAAQELAAAASRRGAACEASAYLANLESLNLSLFLEPFPAVDVEANAAALARLTSLRRLSVCGRGPGFLLGPPALASATLTKLELGVCVDLDLVPIYNCPALRELSLLQAPTSVEALFGTWPAPLPALTKLALCRCVGNARASQPATLGFA